MINYKWIIAREFAPIENNLEKVIKSVHWRYQATEDDITTDIYGQHILKEVDPENFTPYEEITNELIIKWLEKALDVKSLQQNLKNQIKDIKNPKTIIDTNFYTE